MDLHFRNITEDDLEMIMNWRTLPEVTSYMYTDFEPNLEQQREWYTAIGKDPHRLDWIIEADGTDVGLVSIVKIDPVNHRAEWGYYLGSTDVRGKGIGKSVELNILAYVFDELKLNKLCGEVFRDNKLVIEIHQKYGSVIEGTRRSHIFKNGRYRDIVEIGILREEYDKNVRGRFDYTVAEVDAAAKEVVKMQSVPEKGEV